MAIIKEKIKLSDLPETVKFRRANIFLIILGYIFAVFAGINGVQGIHNLMYTLLGVLPSGWINRLIDVIQILCIYGLYRWGSAYAWGKEYTPGKDGVSMYEHPKYDTSTRINGVCILFVFLITAVIYGCTLKW